MTHHKSDINRLRASIGFVFQDFNLFAHLTAMQNVSIGPTQGDADAQGAGAGPGPG